MINYDQKKQLIVVREYDAEEFNAPVGAYKPPQERSWLDKLAFVDSCEEEDLNNLYRYGS